MSCERSIAVSESWQREQHVERQQYGQRQQQQRDERECLGSGLHLSHGVINRLMHSIDSQTIKRKEPNSPAESQNNTNAIPTTHMSRFGYKRGRFL